MTNNIIYLEFYLIPCNILYFFTTGMSSNVIELALFFLYAYLFNSYVAAHAIKRTI